MQNRSGVLAHDQLGHRKEKYKCKESTVLTKDRDESGGSSSLKQSAWLLIVHHLKI